LVLFAIVLGTNAQKTDLKQLIPNDPDTRVGKLANGMTYFIRKNAKPEKRVELRLAVAAGSVLENDDQKGLAHFVEHMCFNGTKNFPKNDLIHYLQSVGVKFGADVNAYTSFDETVYMLTVPSDSAKILNNGIQIMYDWANAVSFDTAEISKERGVVTEEWRLGRGAWQRMADQYLPVLFKDSKYANRLPIGDNNIIQNAKPETIVQFYKDWYRPDLMAFIVIGDIDVDQMEKKIKDQFSKLENPKNIRKKEKYTIPDNKEQLVKVVADKENTYTAVMWICKTDVTPYKTVNDMRNTYIQNLFTGMMNQRLNELKESANAPFMYGQVSYGDIWSRSKNAYQAFCMVADTAIEAGLKAIVTENERVKRYGFTQTELDRYKKNILISVEKSYIGRATNESSTYANAYVQKFLNDEAFAGIEFEYEFVKKNLEGITLKEVNDIAKIWITDENNVLLVLGIDKAGVKLPKESELLEWTKSAKSAKIVAYKDKEMAKSLLQHDPTPGKILTEKKIDEIGVTELTFSNGMKAVLKPTDFKTDEVVISTTGAGGRTTCTDEDYISSSVISYWSEDNGVGSFSKSDLQKMLSGKDVRRYEIGFNEYDEGFYGLSSKKDIETLLQLQYLYFTEPRNDAKSFKVFMNMLKTYYQNAQNDPRSYFIDEANRIKYNNNMRSPGRIPTESELNSISLEKIFKIYNTRFSNAANFTVFVVGTFNVDSIKPLLEKYLASLPTQNKTDDFKDNGCTSVKGPVEKEIKRGKDPKSMVLYSIEYPVEWNKTDAHLHWSFQNILKRILTDKLREEMSGVYGFRCSISMSKIPNGKFSLNLSIPCAPENTDKLLNAAIEEIKKIQENGVPEQQIIDEKETQRRNKEDERKQNESWAYFLERMYLHKAENIAEFVNYEKEIDAISSIEIQRVAKKYIDLNNFVKVVLNPENDKK